jgi:hypothetical protein
VFGGFKKKKKKQEVSRKRQTEKEETKRKDKITSFCKKYHLRYLISF